MTAYIIRRITAAVLLLLVIASLIFFLVRFLPGDPALLILGGETGGNVSKEEIRAVRKQLGLTKPLYVQYFDYLKGIVQLDWGKSYFTDQSVVAAISKRFPVSFQLIIMALGLATFVGIPLGVVAAINRSSIVDTLISLFATLGIAVPVFVIGTLAILVFGLKLNWFPTSSFVPISEGFGKNLWYTFLPAITLSVQNWAFITRITRSSTLDVLEKDYVKTARAKGLKENVVLYKHVLRNSLIAVVTVIGLQMGRMLGSMVLVEFVFNLPGISTLLVNSATSRDYPVIQGVTLLVAFFFVVINLVVDLSYGLLDPQVTYD